MVHRQSLDIQFIAVTMLVVSLLGVQAVRDLIEEDHTELAMMENSSLVDDKINGITQKIRLPASKPRTIFETPKESTSSIEQVTQLDLHCSKKSIPQISIKGNFLQFKGKSCLGDMNFKDVEIINKTNGYTASVFLSGVDKYQTDLIQLNTGENEITVRYKESNGELVEQTVRVVASRM